MIGSSLYADKAQKQKDQIEAVLNNDVVGNDVSGDGRSENGLVHVFSEEPADSRSRELARYVRDTARSYVPSFKADLVFRSDRFSRGGDHTPFATDGFAAVRFTTPAENLGVQHTADDTFDKTSPAYTANVARVNAAAAGEPCASAAPAGCGARTPDRREQRAQSSQPRARQIKVRRCAALERSASRGGSRRIRGRHRARLHLRSGSTKSSLAR